MCAALLYIFSLYKFAESFAHSTVLLKVRHAPEGYALMRFDMAAASSFKVDWGSVG